MVTEEGTHRSSGGTGEPSPIAGRAQTAASMSPTSTAAGTNDIGLARIVYVTHVFGLAHNGEILRPIVALIPVNMVNNLARFKPSALFQRGDKPMDQDAASLAGKRASAPGKTFHAIRSVTVSG